MSRLVIEVRYDGDEEDWEIDLPEYNNNGLELYKKALELNDNNESCIEMDCDMCDVNLDLLAKLNRDCLITATYEYKNWLCEYFKVEYMNGVMIECYEVEWVRTNKIPCGKYKYKEWCEVGEHYVDIEDHWSRNNYPTCGDCMECSKESEII